MALRRRRDHLPYLRVDPRLDPLREEPRFRAIQREMGLDFETPPSSKP